MHPENDDYCDAANYTFDNLMDQIRHILWDEAPEEIKPVKNPYELEI